MKTLSFLIIALLITTTPSLAQTTGVSYDALVAPMDRAIQQADEMYDAVQLAGSEEDAKPQEQRYDEQTVPMNKAADIHYSEGANIQTIVDQNQ